MENREMENKKLTRDIESFQKGKKEAFRDIYEESKKYLYATIRNSLRKAEDESVCEDLLQNTYLEIYKGLDQLRAPEAFKGWAASIAHHQVAHYYGNAVMMEQGQEEAILNIPESDLDLLPESAMDNKATQELLWEIIDALPVNQKIVIEGYYYNQLSIKELSEAMGVPENTVKTYHRRAKLAIKEGVIELEKKQGVKLRSIGIGVALFFLYGERAAAAAPGSIGLEKVNGLIGKKGAGGAGKAMFLKGIAAFTALVVIGVVSVLLFQGGRGQEDVSPQESAEWSEASDGSDAFIATGQEPEGAVSDDNATSQENTVVEDVEETKEEEFAEPKYRPAMAEIEQMAKLFLEEMQNDEEFYVGTDRYGLYDLTGAGKPDLIPGHAALILHYVSGSPILKDLYYSWVMAEPFFDLDKDALILYYYPLEGVEAPEFWIVLTYDESGECTEELDFNDNVSSTAREQYEAYVGEDRIIRIPTDHLIEEATLETVKDNILSYYDGLGYVPNPADMD